MRFLDSTSPMDWFAILLRWMAILAMAVGLALTGGLTPVPGAVLLFLLAWNCYLSVLATLNRRLDVYRLPAVLIDGAASLLLFVASGGIRGPLSWAALPAIFSAAVYYGWRGSLGAALLISLAQAGLTLPLVAWPASAFPIGLTVSINLILGLAVGLIARGLARSSRSAHQTQTNIRRELETSFKRQEHERMQALYNLMATLSATLNYQVVLDTALDLSVQALNDADNIADQMVSAVMLFADDSLQVGSARRFTPSDLRVRLPGSEGAVAQALTSGEPAFCAKPDEDSELNRLIALRGCQSAYCLPLISGLNVYGILLFAHPDADYFTPERREVLEIIGHQAVLAIQNARLYQDLAQEKERIVEAQEEARKKLARDLHDGPTQSVAAIAMRVNFVRRLLERNPENAASELAKIEELAFRTNKEIRHMLFTLRPLTLESEGLIAALNAMADKMRETFNQNVLVEVDPAVVNALEIGKQTVVFYIVEEAVNNARKHADADHIWVRLRPVRQEKDLALLEIQDDGVGFDVDEVNHSYDSRGSLGMVNLRERTELINGLLHLESAVGRGTHVQVFIPLSEEVADRLHRVH